MPTRRRAREVAFQMLYESDFGTERSAEDQQEFVSARMRDHKQLSEFSTSLILGVLTHRDELDVWLTRHSTNWSLSRMAAIDRNILRLGCYEILHSDAPGGVVINEALEIAKRFGGENSRKFINGILDQVLAESENTNVPATQSET